MPRSRFRMAEALNATRAVAVSIRVACPSRDAVPIPTGITLLPMLKIGRPRRQLELIRCRAGKSADFEVEARDATGRIAHSSAVVDKTDKKKIGRRRAADGVNEPWRDDQNVL